MKKFLVIISIMVLVTLGSAGVTKVLKTDKTAKADEFTIVTSFYPTYIAAKNVAAGIESVNVVNLTENHSGCLHDYQLTTNDMRKLESADVFIMNGGGMEGFIQDVAAKYPRLTVIDASTGISFLELMEGHHHEQEEVAGHAHAHETNAHVWMDPMRYEAQIKNIVEGLRKADPRNRKAYEENQKVYLKKIGHIRKQLDALKVDNHPPIIIFHEAFTYLAEYLGYDVVYCMDLDDESGLSAGDIAQVVDEVKEHDVKVLFTETQYKDSIVTNISKETDAKVYVLSALTGERYIEGMEKNIEVLKTVFA